VLENGVCVRRSFRSRILLRGGNGNGPSVAGSNDGAARDETRERIAEPLVADAELGAKLRAAAGAGPAKSVEHDGVEIARGVVLYGVLARGESEVDVRIVAGDELKAERIGSGGGAVLDGEEKGVLLTPDVEVGIAPCVEVAASAERLAGLRASAAIFACMMHDEDGDVVLALQRTEVAEQRGDLTGVVLVDAVQAHEGIKDEETRRVSADGVAQPRLIASAIEAEHGHGDDVDGDAGELGVSSAADASEARFDDRRRVLGHVEEDGPCVVDVEGAEACGARGDGDGEIEREP